MQPSSGSCFGQTDERVRGEDVPFTGQPQTVGQVEHRLKVSHLNVVPDISTTSVTPATEVIVHAPIAGVHATGRNLPSAGHCFEPMFLCGRTKTIIWQLNIAFAVSDTLADYVPQLDPSGHTPCSIALALLDRSFEEDPHLCTVDLQVESALPLSPLFRAIERTTQFLISLNPSQPSNSPTMSGWSGSVDSALAS